MEGKMENTFKIINDNGEEVMCDVLFTFDSEETKKSYIVYTDNSKDENGKIQVYASIYDPSDKSKKLEEIKTDREWQVVNTVLESIHEELNKNN